MNESDAAAREFEDDVRGPDAWTQPMAEVLHHVKQLTDRAEWGLFRFSGDAWEGKMTQIEITAFPAEDEFSEDVRPEHWVRIRFALTDGVLTVTDTDQRPMTPHDLANALDMPWGTAGIMSGLVQLGLRDALRFYNAVHGPPARGAGAVAPRPPTELTRVDLRTDSGGEPTIRAHLDAPDLEEKDLLHDLMPAAPVPPQDARVPQVWDLPVVHALDAAEQLPGFAPEHVEWGWFRFWGDGWASPMKQVTLYAYRAGDDGPASVRFAVSEGRFTVTGRDEHPITAHDIADLLDVPVPSAVQVTGLLASALPRALSAYNTAHYPPRPAAPAPMTAPVLAPTPSAGSRSHRRQIAGLGRSLGGFPFSRG